MRKTALRTLAALASLALLSFPHDSASQSCLNPAARNLLAGAYADSVLNPPGQEDNQFFTSSGGYPNIFFLIDTSGSMVRLPPNGPPSNLTGSMPPANQVGCGAAVANGTLPLGTVLDIVKQRTYHSACAGTPWEALRYQGDMTIVGGVDYAQAAAVCPHYTAANTFATGDPGYDPDFYADTDNLSAGGGKPNLFPKHFVFHDSLNGTPWTRSATDPNGVADPQLKYGDGWSFTNVYPWQVSNNTAGTIAQFCAAQGATLQNGVTRESICNSCLTRRGWYYDGTVGTWNAEFAPQSVGTVTVPSLWFTGNYLNFFPPKFSVARRVVKDVISNQTRIRMAMAQFGDPGYQFVRDFNPSCQSVFGGGNWDQNRSTYVNDVNALSWGGGTPLAMSLFDVGRYYHTASLPWFGAAWEQSGPGSESATSANQLAVCWSCQNSTVILLTDGVPSATDGVTPISLPPGTSSIADSNSGKYAGSTSTGILSPNATDCPKCYAFSGGDDFKNNLIKTAFYFHNYDLRGEAAGACGGSGGTLDGNGMPGKQVLDIYTVGFGVGGLGDASTILSNTAAVGGGIFEAAESASDLRAGLDAVFQTINTRATSFSVATVSTLQTTTGHSVIVPRFDPSQAGDWPGHLFRYELYSEFVNTCTPNGPGDLDCDGLCASVFLTDKDGHFIGEDGNGSFVQTDNGRPPCSQTPRCVALGMACGNLTNVPANPWWDAYQALKNQTWSSRYVWTVTDSNGDGKVDSADTMIRLDTSDATADALVPYLGLGTNGTVCSRIASRIETAGDPVTAQVVSSSKRDCAKAIIRWVLGADVLNETGRSAAQGWPPPRPDMTNPATVGDPTATPPVAANLPNQDLLLDRPFKLGDVYHSSPVVVDAPLPSDGILCPNGLHNQCMESLWRTPVKNVSDLNQYDLYSKSAAYQNRRKVILVGANDGLLHAFNGGAWHPNQDDSVTAGIDESKAPFNGYYDRGEVDGPVELWAFLPPDLIGKIPNLLGTTHHLYVDGTAMVRDVWVDGAGNGLSPGANLDGMKSASEFHTVAVVGERRGGNHYFALDVTNATKLVTESGNHGPKFLWVYPQPNDPESLGFGETYTEFLPIPPPVGPVRIKADANAQSYGLADAANAPEMAVPEDPTTPVKYHELWVTILPGGYDPSYLRGRGVHMVDVWRGTEVFDFSYDASAAAADPRSGLEYPIAATPAMVMWGKSARRPTLGFENDGYFDTATFGDTGGQLWALRFNRPATLSASGKATNWAGGRILGSYSQYYAPTDPRGSLCTIRGGLPFFYITANTALPGSHVFRVYAGTGDRFNLLDPNGGTCGPDNIRACSQRACTVSLPIANNVATATGAGYDGRGMAQPACANWQTDVFTLSQNVASAPPACGATTSTKIDVTCPATWSTGASAFSKDVAVTCTPDADGTYGCVTSKASLATSQASFGQTLDVTPPMSTYWMSRNWYFSLKVFEDSGVRNIFDSPSAAATFDANRMVFYDYVTSVGPPVSAAASAWTWDFRSLVLIDGSSNNPTTLADATSPGWAIYYNHGPQVTASDHVYRVNVLDERTSSVSGLYGKVLWNTIQTTQGEATSATAGCVQSKCQGAFYRVSYHYGADAITGGPVFQDASGNPQRSVAQNTLVPAQGDQPTVFVNQTGQIAVGLTAVNPEKGASNLGMSAAMDPVMGLGVVEVSRDLHNCRHSSSAVGATPPDPSKCN